MTVAFVLSGGASLGAVEVGMLKALARQGVTPDLIVGTSVGALNGAWLAGHPGADLADLERVWLGIRRSTVFPADPVLGLFAFAGRRAGLVSARGLRTLVQQHVTFERIENAAIPLHLVAVEVLTGRDVAVLGPSARRGPRQCCDPRRLRPGGDRRGALHGRRSGLEYADLARRRSRGGPDLGDVCRLRLRT